MAAHVRVSPTPRLRNRHTPDRRQPKPSRLPNGEIGIVVDHHESAPWTDRLLATEIGSPGDDLSGDGTVEQEAGEQHHFTRSDIGHP